MTVAVVVAAIGALIAWWFGWDGIWVFPLMVLLSPLLYLTERAKARKSRARDGRPTTLPSPDAPGRTPIPPPKSSQPCCASPEPVDACNLKDEHYVPCRACGRGTLRIASHWIS